jgi:hypothetical protein
METGVVHPECGVSEFIQYLSHEQKRLMTPDGFLAQVRA